MSSQRRDTELWASRLETYLWLVDPEWRDVSKPWSKVSLRLTSTQLNLLERGHHMLDLLEQGYLQIDEELFEYIGQMDWLICCLSDYSLFTAKNASNT